MSSATNIVVGRLGLAAAAGPAERRAPTSYGLARLGIVPSDDDLVPAPASHGMDVDGSCGAGVLLGPASQMPPSQDAGKMPAPQPETRADCSCPNPDVPAAPEAAAEMMPAMTSEPVPAEPAPCEPPTAAEVQAQPQAGGTDKKRSFRLPGRLANCLKAYAATTGQYQYIVATEALQEFLDGAVPALDFAGRARLAELQSRLEAAAAAAPATAELPRPGGP